MSISIHTKFENASLGSWNIDRDVITLTPVGGAENPWFYFLVSFVADRELTFRIPALAGESQCPVSISYDRAHWLPIDQVEGLPAFRYRFQADDAIVSLTPPYTNGMLYEFTLWAARSPHAHVNYINTEAPPSSEPCTCFTISNMGQISDKPVVWVVGRQHPSEAASSWLAEGMIRFLLSPNETACRLRKKYVFKVVPMMDVKGVFTASNTALAWKDVGMSASVTDIDAVSSLMVTDSQSANGLAFVLNLRSHLIGGTGRCQIGSPSDQGTPDWLKQAAKHLPWYKWDITQDTADNDFFAYVTKICPTAKFAEVETSWYFDSNPMTKLANGRKNQQDLLHEGELLLRALSGYLDINPL